MQQKMQWLEFSGTHLILLIRKKHCDSKGSGPWTQHCIEMVMNPAQYIPMHWHLHYNLQNNLVKNSTGLRRAVSQVLLEIGQYSVKEI